MTADEIYDNAWDDLSIKVEIAHQLAVLNAFLRGFSSRAGTDEINVVVREGSQ